MINKLGAVLLHAATAATLLVAPYSTPNDSPALCGTDAECAQWSCDHGELPTGYAAGKGWCDVVIVPDGTVTDDTWWCLRDLGHRGVAWDSMEALYPTLGDLAWCESGRLV